jgi:DNA-directed RNA polymerase specialized sigma24 family protein
MSEKESDPPPSGRQPSLHESGASLAESHASQSRSDATVQATDAPVRRIDASVHNEGASLRGNDPPLANVIPLRSVSPEVVRDFLARMETRRMMLALVAAKVPSADVEDIVHDAMTEAIDALQRKPPERVEALPGWVATITRRVVADFVTKRVRRAKYEGPMPDVVEAQPPEDGLPGDFPAAVEPSYDPRVVDHDSDVDPWLVRRWLERQVAALPRDKETFEILLEHAQGNKTYQRIAREREVTLTALSSRIFEFKSKYIPRYRQWRNRALLLIVLGGVAVIAAILALWLLRRPSAIGPDPAWTPPRREPTPSATPSARPPPFEPALPPRNLSPDKP